MAAVDLQGVFAPALAALSTVSPSNTVPFESSDSGYASNGTTPEEKSVQTSADPTQGVKVSRNLFKRKLTKLKPFNQEIPKSVRDRYCDLSELYSKPLSKILANSGVTSRPISINLRVLGESEEAAKPWIIAMCDPRMSKRAQHGSDQISIQAQ